MKKIYLVLFLFLLICFIASCSKGGKGGGTPVQPSLLVGKWNLQQQKTVVYVDGVKQTDTTLLASINNVGYAQFNKDNSFVSASMSRSNLTGGNVPGGAVAVDSTSGTYHVVSATLTLSAPLAGLGGGTGSFSTGTSVPVFTMISNSTQITLLTATTLNMHTEYIYTATTTANTKTYKNELDYYYGK